MKLKEPKGAILNTLSNCSNAAAGREQATREPGVGVGAGRPKG